MWGALGALLGCHAQPAPEVRTEPPPAAKSGATAAAPAAEPPAGAGQGEPQDFGGAIDPAVPELALAELLKAPSAHAGKTIRTSGTIERVCQRMGCWMEIRDAGAPSAVRVPMAGHAFFLPKDVAGKRATVQGEVTVTPLTAEHEAHLKEEGAQATDVDVAIVATGVRVH